MTCTFNITGTVFKVFKLQTIRNTYRLDLTIAQKITAAGKTHTEYNTITLWDRKAEAAYTNLRKGSKITARGAVNQVQNHKGKRTYLNVRWIKYLANFGGPREQQMELPLGA